MEYNFRDIEKRWQDHWAKNKTFATKNDFSKPKYYVLDMFPYPSGSGLHVGHPLGYIASDIVARYKRLKGFNVLHPMGYDMFGLPAEQYAIQTGQHPAITTKNNIARYREQMDKIGFSFDWDREVQTADPKFYKWTQLIFIKLFNSWYNPETNKAESIDTLIEKFKIADYRLQINGNEKKWDELSEIEKSEHLMNYRLAYLSETFVNWCPAMGTVLANEEVKDGVSERGGYPVERKLMPQWSLRITTYADRLVNDLESLDWTEAIKEQQRNWIGKSEGTSLRFGLIPSPSPQEKGVCSDRDQIPLFETGKREIWNILLERSRENRKDQTPAEKILWERVRNNNLGVKFRRQHVIEQFIADFASLEKNLIIEVDGEIHLTQKEYDEQRTLVLENIGFNLIRFTNDEVIYKTDWVCDQIKKALSLPSPAEKAESQNDRDEAQFTIEVFTTRPDTIFGVTFLTLAPEHELVNQITTPEFKKQVDDYVTAAKARSERERMADVKKITGQFTGGFALHPFSGKQIPIWIGDYVLAGYGTGAVMAVPGHDERDYAFAKHFGLEIITVVQPLSPSPAEKVESQSDREEAESSYDAKEGKLINSDFLNGLDVKDAIKKAISEIEKNNLGKGKTNYRLRDAIFGRQRYWGEPIPIYYENGIPKTMKEEHLPLVLPEIDKFLPTETGEPPLARALNWYYDPKIGVHSPSPVEKVEEPVLSLSKEDEAKFKFETTTMPGWAGSSWYYLRYMDPHNEKEFVSKDAVNYWKDVDLYIGGNEHATGHLLYVRFWTKFLFDLGLIPITEPAKKLINQGMIQGVSEKIWRARYVGKEDNNAYTELKIIIGDQIRSYPLKTETRNIFFSNRIGSEFTAGLDKNLNLEFLLAMFSPINVEICLVEPRISMDAMCELRINDFLKWNNQDQNSVFVCKGGYWQNGIFMSFNNNEGQEFYTFPEIEKMSKSKWNTVNPDDICNQFGSDSLRLYEMFLGPLEQSKPWNTNGITGVLGFLKKYWRLFHFPSPVEKAESQRDRDEAFIVSEDAPTKAELKSLHKTIKKATEDIERYSFNTSVSNFMICANELTELKCNKRAILEPLTILIAPYAPHIAEELWKKLGHNDGVSYATWPIFEEKYLVESAFKYPVSFNGKTRFFHELELSLSKEDVEKEVLALEETKKYLDGKPPKKIIVVHNKIVNIVV